MTERDDEQRLRLFAELHRTGSTEARSALVESYQPLALYFARRYRNRGVESADLQQVANLALLKAIDRFDPDVGVQFSTYAGRTIDGELKRHFRDKSWAVRVPRSLQETSMEVRTAVDSLSNQLDRSPTVDEIAEHLGWEADTVIEALDVGSAYRAQSLDRPARTGDDDGSTTEGQRLPTTEEGFERAERAMMAEELLKQLPEREKRILEMTFYREMSQTTIADELGISQMHVSRLLRRTLERLQAEVDRPEVDQST